MLHLARKLEAMVLSSDGVVRAFAKKQCVECHGVLWVLDRLLEESLLENSTTCEKLEGLIGKNRFYQNNPVLMEAIKERLQNRAG